MPSRRSRQARRDPAVGRRLLSRAFLGNLLIVIATAVATAAVVLAQVEHVTNIVRGAEALHLSDVTTKVKPGHAQTILLIGSDRRYQGRQLLDARSDTMMLVRLDPDSRAITVLRSPATCPSPWAGGPRRSTRRSPSAANAPSSQTSAPCWASTSTMS